MTASNPLLPFDEALSRLLALGTPLPAQTLPIAQTAGRYLAAPVTACLTQPQADVSAMDGYAIRFEDLPGPLAVIGESAAGRPFTGTVQPGQATRIFTGAHVPAGADTVAVQEDAVVTDGYVHFPADGPARFGAHIRHRGLDFAEGAPLAETGAAITPARLGLLAAAGLATLPVHRAPTVAILSTGDELVPVGMKPGAGQIIGSNGLMIATLLSATGAAITDLGIVADRTEDLGAALERARSFDVLVTIGGASVGDHDLVKPALSAAGATIDFWRIALRPGKPLLAGMLGATIVVGLPGNPSSAFVCARLFLTPLLRHLAGDPAPRDTPVLARTTQPLPANGPRRDFIRARLEPGPDGPTITPTGAQDSSLLSTLAAANALLVRPENAPAVPAGAAVTALSI